MSKIENSDVSGKTGGFSVLANEKKENVYTGHAGGYVGMMSGAEITSSNVDQFNYIVGGESAGGYAGTLEPGNVASVLGEADILDGLVSADNLLSALQTFVPFITKLYLLVATLPDFSTIAIKLSCLSLTMSAILSSIFPIPVLS